MVTLLKAFGAVLFLRVALRLASYPHVLRLVKQRSLPLSSALVAERQEEVGRIVWAVKAASRRLLGDRPCLPQALAAKWLLGRSGVPSTLRLGASKRPNQGIEAHAWLEVDGIIVIGGRASPHEYTQFRQFNRDNH